VLPGVTVTVRGPNLQKESATAASGPSGTYRVALLPPGTYDITVELQGFAGQSRKSVEVAINQQTTLDFTLAVGGLAFGDVDLRLEKTFELGGRQALSILAEAFNLLNRDNVRNVSAVAGPDFGTPTTYYNGREIQLDVRYLFGGR
jgi:hypothetical protein